MYFKKDDLSNLLNTLSLGEKKYFNQYLKSLNHKETPFYLDLLDAIQNEKSELASLPEMKSVQAFTTAKSRLHKHLLRALRHYHQNKSVEIIIQNLLCEVEILYDHGLPEQSMVLLEKAYSKSITHELYELTLQILSWERKLAIILNNPKRISQEIAQEEKKVLENLNQIIELENIYIKAKEIKKQYGYVKGKTKLELEAISIKNPYFTSQYNHGSQRGKYYYHCIHFSYYWMSFDHHKAYQHSKEFMAVEMQKILPANQYVEGVLEHVTSCLGMGYFKEMLINLEIAETFIKLRKFDHSKSFSIRMFYYQSCYKLMAYIYMGSLDNLQKTIKETEEKVIFYDRQLSLEQKLVIHGNLRNACIAIGDLNKAEQLLEMMLQKETKSVRSDVYNDLFLSRVFSVLASKIYVLVPAMAMSAHRRYRQIKSKETDLEVELTITSILMKDYDYQDKKTRNEILSKVKDALVKHMTLSKGLNYFQEIYSFYVIWTDSLLLDQPFHITAANWYQQFIEVSKTENKEH